MNFEILNYKYLEDATTLAIKNYMMEQKHVEAFREKSYQSEITNSVKEVFNHNIGVVAVENGKLQGYLAFEESWNTSGNIKGIRSPLVGYGVQGNDRSKIISLLFQHASEHLCKQYVGVYNITIYAHDMDVISSYVLNNFGIMCTDTIRAIDKPIVAELNENYKYEKLPKDQTNQLYTLYEELINHLRKSPSYYPGEEFSAKAFLDYLNQENTSVFVAKSQEEIICMMDGSSDGNNFIGNDKDTIHVGDLYCCPSYRGQNVAQSLLQYVSDIFQQNGLKYMGVEHGTINPTAIRFWDKYFDRYTYTLTRKIDERMLG